MTFPLIVERGRTRRKRRDFFGTIKKRLSRSKTRSRSAGPEGDVNHEDPRSRSVSADPGSGMSGSMDNVRAIVLEGKLEKLANAIKTRTVECIEMNLPKILI